MDELLQGEHKRMREEILRVIRTEIGQMKSNICRESAASETDSMYDTIDDEGNVVPEPSQRRATFSAASETVMVDTRSGANRQDTNGSKMTKRDGVTQWHS